MKNRINPIFLGALAVLLIAGTYLTILQHTSKAINLPKAAGTQAEKAPHQFLVKFRSNAPKGVVEKVLKDTGLTQKDSIPDINTLVVNATKSANDEAILNLLKHSPWIESVDQDMIVKPQTAYLLPNDPLFPSYQWGKYKVGGPYAWNITTGSPSILIADIDTGVDITNPDLAPQIVSPHNVVTGTSDVTDSYGHGTVTSGVAAAATNNSIGVAGMCWQCKIMPIKAADASNTIYQDKVEAGLTWAADHGAKVANISLGLTPDSALANAANYFRSKGGIIIAGAGNSGTNLGLPSTPYMVTVTASDSNDQHYSWSNYGNDIDLTAPGEDYSTTSSSVSSGNYYDASGTSISTPFVSGLAGLLYSINPSFTPDQVENLMESTAVDLGAPGWDQYFGWGRIDAYAAVSKAAGLSTAGPDTTPPTTTITYPSVNSTVVADSTGTVSGITVSATDPAPNASGINHVDLYEDSVKVATDTAAPYTFTLANQTAGSHSLAAVATDNAGNVGYSAGVVFTVASSTDTTPPTESITAPASGATVSGSVPVSVTASDNTGISTIKVDVDGTVVGSSTTSPYSFTWNSTSASNGTHALTVTATDTAGNSSSSSENIIVNNTTATDTTPPTVTISAPINGSTVKGTTPISITASDNSGGTVTTTVQVDGTTVGTITNSGTLNWDTTKHANGTATVTTLSTDPSGNQTTASVSVTINNTVADTVPPVVAITAPTNGTSITSTKNLTVTISATDNVAVTKTELYVDNTLVTSSTTSPFTMKWNCSKASKGTHTLIVKAYDAAGNVGTSPAVSVTK